MTLLNHEKQELCKITEACIFSEFQQMQQLKWLALITRRENNGVIKRVPFHTTTKKKYKDTPIYMLRAITVSEHRNFFFYPEKNLRYDKIQPTVLLAARSMNAEISPYI